MPAPSPLGTAIRDALDADGRFGEHPAGHSETLLRYVTPAGVPFAVGRNEIAGVRFWVAESEAFRVSAEAAGLACTLSPPKAKGVPGRNSNLDQIPGFKRRPLLWVRVTSPQQALLAAALHLAATVEVPVPAAEPASEPVPPAEPARPAEPVRPEAAAPAPPAVESAPEASPASPGPVETVEPAQATAAIIEPPRPPSPPETPLAPEAPAPRRGLIGRIAARLLGR